MLSDRVLNERIGRIVKRGLNKLLNKGFTGTRRLYCRRIDMGPAISRDPFDKTFFLHALNALKDRRVPNRAGGANIGMKF